MLSTVPTTTTKILYISTRGEPMSVCKVRIKRQDFFLLVSQVYGLIEKRAVLPILSKVLISAQKDYLSIKATDQDNSLQTRVSAKVEEEGHAVVDTQNLFDILKELPEGDISLVGQSSGKRLKLSQGHAVFQLLSQKAEDFPSFPQFQMKQAFTLETQFLKYLIDKTAYCSSTDETRYHLTGVFFETLGNSSRGADGGEGLNFRFVATDGHRLGLAEWPSTLKTPLKKGVIISKKGIQEIKKLISYSEEKEKVEISVLPPRILLRYKEATLSVKLVEGNYPNYQPLIPKGSEVSVLLNTEVFSQTLKRVSLLSSNRFKGVNFQIQEKKIQMEAENPELGSARDELDCIRKKGGDLKVRFNARYMIEALSSISTEETLLELGGEEAPCVIRPVLDKKEQAKGQNSLCVVMPMKI